MSGEVTNRNWIGKVAAGLICGYLFALGCAGLWRYAAGAIPNMYGPPGMVSVQTISIVWTTVVSLVFLFGSARAAWGWLGLAAGLLWALLFALGVAA